MITMMYSSLKTMLITLCIYVSCCASTSDLFLYPSTVNCLLNVWRPKPPSKLYVSKIDKKQEEYALRERLYRFPMVRGDEERSRVLWAYLARYLKPIPYGKEVAVCIFKQFEGCVKNSWEIDCIIDRLVDEAFLAIRPPLSYASRIQYRYYVEKVIMGLALPK
jgi:hypothetical protein